jgi:hypothetical protein
MVTRSVTGCMPTRRVGTNTASRAGSLPQGIGVHLIVPTLRVDMPPGTLGVPLATQGVSLVQW